jgi:hypothetical protein
MASMIYMKLLLVLMLLFSVRILQAQEKETLLRLAPGTKMRATIADKTAELEVVMPEVIRVQFLRKDGGRYLVIPVKTVAYGDEFYIEVEFISPMDQQTIQVTVEGAYTPTRIELFQQQKASVFRSTALTAKKPEITN